MNNTFLLATLLFVGFASSILTAMLDEFDITNATPFKINAKVFFDNNTMVIVPMLNVDDTSNSIHNRRIRSIRFRANSATIYPGFTDWIIRVDDKNKRIASITLKEHYLQADPALYNGSYEIALENRTVEQGNALPYHKEDV